MFPGRSESLRSSIAILAAVALMALLLACVPAAAFAVLPETAAPAAPAASSRATYDAGDYHSTSPGFSAATPARAPPA